MRTARLRLVSLWLSQCARVLGDWCLRLTVVVQLSAVGGSARDTAWHIATAVFIAPFLLLAPLNGCVSNSLPRRAVLVGSSAWALVAVGLCAALGTPWIVCLGLVAPAAALYSPARYALLPAAAIDTDLPLTRVNGWIEMGGAAAIVGGIALGVELTGTHPEALVSMLLALNVLSLIAALPAVFPADVLRPERPLAAVAGFFRDLRRVAVDGPSIGPLIGLATFQAVVTAGSGALVAITLGPTSGENERILHALALVMAGAALGCALAGAHSHPRRSLGFVPLGATLLLIALGWAGLSREGLPVVPCVLLGLGGGLVNVPLRAAYMAAVPADARGNAMAVMNGAIYLLTTLLALLVYLLTANNVLHGASAQFVLLVVLTTLGALAAWYLLLPQVLESILEVLFWFMYDIRGHGPGVAAFPRRGPLLVVANHTAYADPFWIGKVAPRQLRPMMTSMFYDLPVVRWLMVHIVGAIRVPVSTFRREAPELNDAIAVLRKGGAVLLFPEGMLRRVPEPTVRLFGQGIWHILREMPQTPVVLCWIEGGWGSFSSYCGGPPMKNKRLDRRRCIDVAIDVPRVLPPEVLADPMRTRIYLMRACLACRRFLGLEVPPLEKCGPWVVDGGGDTR